MCMCGWVGTLVCCDGAWEGKWGVAYERSYTSAAESSVWRRAGGCWLPKGGLSSRFRAVH